MHELSICEAIVGRLRPYLEENPGCRVRRVFVEIGRLSGVDPEALRFAFPAATQSAGLAGIELEIARRPVTLRCCACGVEAEVKNFEMKCGACGSAEVKIAGGRELKITSFEIEEE